ncbi:hypothetical protein RFI_12694, partial [Reticulomyxa filosa]
MYGSVETCLIKNEKINLRKVQSRANKNKCNIVSSQKGHLKSSSIYEQYEQSSCTTEMSWILLTWAGIIIIILVEYFAQKGSLGSCAFFFFFLLEKSEDVLPAHKLRDIQPHLFRIETTVSKFHNTHKLQIADPDEIAYQWGITLAEHGTKVFIRGFYLSYFASTICNVLWTMCMVSNVESVGILCALAMFVLLCLCAYICYRHICDYHYHHNDFLQMHHHSIIKQSIQHYWDRKKQRRRSLMQQRIKQKKKKETLVKDLTSE